MSSVDIPTKESPVDILGQAYQHAVFPDPFEGEGKEATQRAASRLSAIPFAQYWTNLFTEFRDKYNGNPAGFFAQETFRTAEKLEGEELRNAVAQQLADKLGDHVLEAGLDIPDLPELNEQTLTGLAAFLVEKRNHLEGGGMKLGAQPQEISNDWIRFAALLDQTQHELSQFIVGEATHLWDAEKTDTDGEIAVWEGMMGGYGVADQNHALGVVLAKVLARHFPDIVISKLKEAPRYNFTYKPVDETRDGVQAIMES